MLGELYAAIICISVLFAVVISSTAFSRFVVLHVTSCLCLSNATPPFLPISRSLPFHLKFGFLKLSAGLGQVSLTRIMYSLWCCLNFLNSYSLLILLLVFYEVILSDFGLICVSISCVLLRFLRIIIIFCMAVFIVLLVWFGFCFSFVCWGCRLVS